ncbi:MAG: hypothetical protein BM557_02100 [Flavobacterium sp. MedPE-SWcel]|uniref:terminase small subunit n=1 Tax=uncultured Flavobacterium sp. TaxID=165435 RepID=UPI00091202FA|nr:terminase small subunit [uncultured Flavobacterium sp.]OIQ22190.1 MAG: hypothetical protein BM557_02100 [Flavobacterium sp. MedPE-SWcel]
MRENKLTIKQEAFAQAYIKLGDKSAAYREAYSTKNMKPNTIHVKANELASNGNVAVRIKQLQEELKDRNQATIDEIVGSLSDMLRFDIADLYDDTGKLKNIKDIPKKARLMISELSIEEIKDLSDKKSTVIGQTKKIKLFDKLNVVEKLMKHFGGYEKDNKQKTIDLGEGWNPEKEKRLEALRSKLSNG